MVPFFISEQLTCFTNQFSRYLNTLLESHQLYYFLKSKRDGTWIFRNAANELAALFKLPRNPKLLRIPINNQVDEIFAAIRVNVSGSGLDPLPLPTDTDDFNVTVIQIDVFLQVFYSFSCYLDL